MKKMFQAVKEINTMRYDMKAQERIETKLMHAHASVKLNLSPRKLYLKNSVTGREILWVTGENNGEALVNPNAFPYFDLNLDPYGSLMRHNQHHTIFEMGFTYATHMIEALVDKEKNSIENYFQISGTTVFDNKPCYIITINYPKYRYVAYTVKQGETIISIARKLDVGEYEILQKNKFSDYNEKLKEGQEIQVPNTYSSKSILYIDEKLFLPLFIQIFDDEGLYEQYEFHNLQVNPFIAPEEFTKNYPGYHF
ncbi:MAG: DUF1571 domain-containing protein [Bacteroidia bacterium]